MIRGWLEVVTLAFLGGATAVAQNYTLQLLRVPTSSEIPYSLTTTVTGVSASGLIVGTVEAAVCDRCPYPPPFYRGFSYQDGTYQIVAVDSNNLNTWITGINDADQMVGYYRENNNFTGSFVMQGGVVTEFAINPPTGPLNEATGINNSGEVVGSTNSGVTTAGFTISGGITTKIAIKGQQYTNAQHVNDNGVVVGYYAKAGPPYHGFVYSNGSFAPLNYPGAAATELAGINNSDVVVGTFTESDGSTGSFLVDSQGFHRFALPNACSTTVAGINNQGVVYGSVVYGSSCTVEYGFVATPK